MAVYVDTGGENVGLSVKLQMPLLLIKISHVLSNK